MSVTFTEQAAQQIVDTVRRIHNSPYNETAVDVPTYGELPVFTFALSEPFELHSGESEFRAKGYPVTWSKEGDYTGSYVTQDSGEQIIYAPTIPNLTSLKYTLGGTVYAVLPSCIRKSGDPAPKIQCVLRGGRWEALLTANQSAYGTLDADLFFAGPNSVTLEDKTGDLKVSAYCMATADHLCAGSKVKVTYSAQDDKWIIDYSDMPVTTFTLTSPFILHTSDSEFRATGTIVNWSGDITTGGYGTTSATGIYIYAPTIPAVSALQYTLGGTVYAVLPSYLWPSGTGPRIQAQFRGVRWEAIVDSRQSARGTLDADLSSGFGNVTLNSNCLNLKVSATCPYAPLTSGKQVTVQYHPQDAEWVIIAAPGC